MSRNRSNNPFERFMAEGEKFSAPFKLVLRLMRYRSKKSLPPESRNTREPQSRLKRFVGWEGFSFVFFIGLAFAFLQLPYQYEKARWCFILAAIALAIKLVHSVDVKLYPRLLITGLAAILAGLVVCRVNDWVTQLELAAYARVTPEVRAVNSGKHNPSSVPSARSYLLFDGPPRHENYDANMQLEANQDFQAGQEIAFNFFFKVTGPNAVEVYEGDGITYVEPDISPSTQRSMIADFKTRIKTRKGLHPIPKEPFTMTPGEPPRFGSALSIDSEGKLRTFTASDLNALRIGAEFIFVLVQMRYKDLNKVHHIRTCQILQPPATSGRNIWASCQGFTKSD